MANIEDLRLEARKLLDEGQVRYLLGYERGPSPWVSSPAFFKSADQLDNLIWDPTCVQNLVRSFDKAGGAHAHGNSVLPAGFQAEKVVEGGDAADHRREDLRDGEVASECPSARACAPGS